MEQYDSKLFSLSIFTPGTCMKYIVPTMHMKKEFYNVWETIGKIWRLCTVLFLYYHLLFSSSPKPKAQVTFLITICPLSVVVDVVVIVIVVVNFSNFPLLLKIHWANFNQIWYKAFLDEKNSRLFIWHVWRATPFYKGT